MPWMLPLTESRAAALNVVVLKSKVCTTLALIFSLFNNHSDHSVILRGFNDPL